MKKGPAMIRPQHGALLMRLTASLMAWSIFATPLAYAQDRVNAPDAPADKTAASSTGSGSLTFTNLENGKQSTADIASIKEKQSSEAEKSEEPSVAQGQDAEVTGSESATADGAELAQADGSASGARLDPRFTKLPTVTGGGLVRKTFGLMAKQELIRNLSFRDTPIKEVIAELARRGNLNILLDKSVFGKVTGDLHDVTLNEAMDAVLGAAGLQSRMLDSNTVIVGSPNALTILGLNRTHYKVFKLSYSNPFNIANILFVSVFNRGFLPDFQGSMKSRLTHVTQENPKSQTASKEDSASAGIGEGGAQRKKESQEQSSNVFESKDEEDNGADYTFSMRLDTQRNQKGTSRIQVQEGTGFNNAAQDPGTQQIRAFQEVATDYIVEQNGGGALVVPDPRTNQVIVVGTPDDIAVAEECIRLLDKRPRQVHIQVSLVELNNQGIRQLGASLNMQGQGASGALLGGAGAPLVNALPGMGSAGPTVTRTNTGTINTNNGVSLIPAGPNPLLGTFTSTQTSVNPAATTVGAPATIYNGILGGFFPALPTTAIAGVTAQAVSSSNFNFLALNKEAGGRTNIATVPMGLNFSVNMLLQQNKAKLLANPSVVVSDNTEALVTLATEVIHKVTSTVSLGVTNVNVELTKAGIFLDVCPHITDDGFVYMRIRPQVSSPAGPVQTFANQTVIVTLLNIREIMAQEVRVKSGQTLVLGGLFSENEAAQISKVPYLAETPLFGALFRNTLKGRDRRELMLMITPKIVEEEPPLAQSPAASGPTL